MPEPNSTPGRSCALCGAPAPHPSWKVSGGERLSFCCPGCLHVFDLLAQLPGGRPQDFRQTDVYRACLAAGIVAPPPERPSGATPLLDEGSGAELALSLEGMWCSACAWVIEEVLRKTRGVLEVSVRFASDSATIRYLPHRVTAEELAAAVARLGYAARRTEQGTGSREGRGLLLRLGTGAILSMYTMMLSLVLYGGFFADLGADAVRFVSLQLWLLGTPAVFYCGAPILRRAWSGVRAGVPTMDALVAAGALSAYAYSVVQLARGSLHLYFDTAATLVAVVLFGRYLELRTKERISGRVRELQELAHGKVRLAGGGGRWVSSLAVAPGDEVVVREGETVAVDGRLSGGAAELDESVLTGESRPVRRGEGESVRAGARVLAGEIRLRADRAGGESSLRVLAREVEEALARKGRTELLADRLTRRLVPAVLLLAGGSAAWLLLAGATAEAALLRGLSVLLITCPCALGIATPLAKVAAVARAREEGVLVRDPAALECAGHLDTVVFDKTGTLTEGRFSLRGLFLHGASRGEALARVASAEAASSHYLAREVRRVARAEGVEPREPESFEAVEGLGVRSRVDGEEVLVGSRRLLATRGVRLPQELDERAVPLEAAGLTAVFAAWGGEARALLVFGDALKAGARAAVDALAAGGVEVWLLSGDSPATTAAVGEAVGVAAGARRGGASPEEKVAFVRELQGRGRRVGVAGDGVNDAAALARADVGFALGGEGAFAAWRAADVALLAGDPRKILAFRELALRTNRILRQNLFFAFAYNVLAIPLALAGALTPLVAVAAMVASSLTVVANTARLSKGAPPAGEAREGPAAARLAGAEEPPEEVLSEEGRPGTAPAAAQGARPAGAPLRTAGAGAREPGSLPG